MELYSKELIKAIQIAIQLEKYELISYDTYDKTILGDTNAILSNGIKLLFKYNRTKDKWDKEIVTRDVTIGKKYISEWKETAIGKFLAKDWTNNVKDLFGNIIYNRFTCRLENGLLLHGIVRQLTELNNGLDNISDYKKYADLKIGDFYYSVIKVWLDSDKFETLSNESFGYVIDDSIRNSIEDDNNALNSVNDKEDENNTENNVDEMNSKSLF